MPVSLSSIRSRFSERSTWRHHKMIEEAAKAGLAFHKSMFD